MEMLTGFLALHLVALVEHVEDVAQADFAEVVFAVNGGGLSQTAALGVPKDAKGSFKVLDQKQLGSNSCR